MLVVGASPRSALFALPVLGQVEGQDAGEDQQVVLALGDVHCVGVADAEPALGGSGDRAASRWMANSWSTRLPRISRSSGPGTSMVKRSPNGVKKCLRISAASSQPIVIR